MRSDTGPRKVALGFSGFAFRAGRRAEIRAAGARSDRATSMPCRATYRALSNELAMGEIDHGSCVIVPDGTVTAVIDGGDGFALADMDLDAVRARRVGGEPVFAQRRPELYAGLLSDTFSRYPAISSRCTATSRGRRGRRRGSRWHR